MFSLTKLFLLFVMLRIEIGGFVIFFLTIHWFISEKTNIPTSFTGQKFKSGSHMKCLWITLRNSQLECLPMHGLIKHVNDFELPTKDYKKSSSRPCVGKQFDWIYYNKYVSASCGNLDNIWVLFQNCVACLYDLTF
jgi:hypothetical protein